MWAAPEMPITEEHRRRRGRNYALGGALLVLVIVFFALTLTRLGDT